MSDGATYERVTAAGRRSRNAALVALSVLVLGLAVAPAGAQEGLAPGSVPEAVVLKDLAGKSVDLGEVIGQKPVLVEFWATWCTICRALEPRVQEAHARYGDRVEFLVVAVGVAQTPAQIRRHMSRHAVTGRVLYDADGRATRAFDAPGTGYVVVLDAAGRVVYTGTGGDQDLTAAVGRALQ